MAENENKEFKNHIKILHFLMTHDPYYEISNKSVVSAKQSFLNGHRKENVLNYTAIKDENITWQVLWTFRASM